MSLRRIVSAALSEAVDSLEEKESPSFPWGLVLPVGFGAALFLHDTYKRTRAWARAQDAILQRIEERLAGADSDRAAIVRLASFLTQRYANHTKAVPGEHPVDSAIRFLTPGDGSDFAWDRARALMIPSAIIPGECRANFEGDVVSVTSNGNGSRIFNVQCVAGDPRKIAPTGYAASAILEHWPIALKGFARD